MKAGRALFDRVGRGAPLRAGLDAVLTVVFASSCAACGDLLDENTVRTGTRFRAPTKMLLGFLMTAAASGVMSLAAYQAAGGAKVSAWWMVLGFTVLTVGEI